MPAFLRNVRSFSFPPSIENIDFASSHDEEDTLPDIDEDPFAHFLTPVVEEDDPYDGMSLSAGIVVADGPRSTKTSKFKSTVADKWARYVRNNHVQLHHRYHEEEEIEQDDEEESFVQLDDDRLLDVPHAMSQLNRPPPRITVAEPTRGRAQELVSRRPGRPRLRASRTLSGRRHSWREPSPDLFTVDESDEDVVLMMRRTRSRREKTRVAAIRTEEAEMQAETKDGGSVRRRSRLDVVEKARL